MSLERGLQVQTVSKRVYQSFKEKGNPKAVQFQNIQRTTILHIIFMN